MLKIAALPGSPMSLTFMCLFSLREAQVLYIEFCYCNTVIQSDARYAICVVLNPRPVSYSSYVCHDALVADQQLAHETPRRFTKCMYRATVCTTTCSLYQSVEEA